MADKVRKIPAAFEGTRAIPAQYTTDPDIATPEQIASIGTATEKARKLAKGQRIVAAAAAGTADRTHEGQGRLLVRDPRAGGAVVQG